jgi:hypothetical protein
LRNNLFIATDTHLFAIDLLTGGCWSLPLDIALESEELEKHGYDTVPAPIPRQVPVDSKEQEAKRAQEENSPDEQAGYAQLQIREEGVDPRQKP